MEETIKSKSIFHADDEGELTEEQANYLEANYGQDILEECRAAKASTSSDNNDPFGSFFCTEIIEKPLPEEAKCSSSIDEDFHALPEEPDHYLDGLTCGFKKHVRSIFE